MTRTPTYGAQRFVKKFTWFPSFICGRFYWLKTVKVTEEFQQDAFAIVSNYTDEIEGYSDDWVPVSVEVIPKQIV